MDLVMTRLSHAESAKTGNSKFLTQRPQSSQREEIFFSEAPRRGFCEATLGLTFRLVKAGRKMKPLRTLRSLCDTSRVVLHSLCLCDLCVRLTGF